MFYYIRGELVHKGENFAVLDANGVGYKIYTSATVLQNLGGIGKEATLYTHLHVKEDVQDLYGFLTNEELSMFLHLLSVSGVGPKAALSILSVASPEKFALAVLSNDKKAITKAAGVGPKLAERVILELRDKLKNSDVGADMPDIELDNNTVSEAVSALTVLGYSQSEAAVAVASVGDGLDLEETVRQALKKLMK